MPYDPLRHFLKQFNYVLRTLPTPPECFGGVTGRSIKHNAMQHINKRYVMNLDIKDFFPSVTTVQVADTLRGHGCFRDISQMLAELVMVNDELPQGFNTSPLLSIQVLAPVVEELRVFLGRKGITFTVWIDDITVSCGESPVALVAPISEICSKHGFTMNTEKYHCGEHGVSIQEVTGVVINGDVLRPADSFIKKTEKMIYVLEKDGLDVVNAAFTKNFPNTAKAIAHLEGRVTWVAQFTPEKAAKLEAKLQRYSIKERAHGVISTLLESILRKDRLVAAPIPRTDLTGTVESKSSEAILSHTSPSL